MGNRGQPWGHAAQARRLGHMPTLGRGGWGLPNALKPVPRAVDREGRGNPQAVNSLMAPQHRQL